MSAQRVARELVFKLGDPDKLQRCAVMLLTGDHNQKFEAAIACGIIPNDTPATIDNIIEVNIELGQRLAQQGMH